MTDILTNSAVLDNSLWNIKSAPQMNSKDLAKAEKSAERFAEKAPVRGGEAEIALKERGHLAVQRLEKDGETVTVYYIFGEKRLHF